MKAIGIDIGGANLKFSDGKQKHLSIPFELWRGPERLAAALSQGLAAFPRGQPLAVTMTGELCDCFESRQAGVAAIVAAVAEAVGPGTPFRFYQTTGELVEAKFAVGNWKLTAAANWHAIATFAARLYSDECGLLIDIGSTTTDLIPFAVGQVKAQGQTDWERTTAGELVYCGAARTPLCAVVPDFEWAGRTLGLAAEWFASVEDAFIYTGVIPECVNDLATCDGRGKTKTLAARRLARQLCSDPEELGEQPLNRLASQACQRVLQRLGRALSAQLVSTQEKGEPCRLILSGSGEWLGRELLRSLGWAGPVTQWSERFCPAASEAAAAFSLANLCGTRERP